MHNEDLGREDGQQPEKETKPSLASMIGANSNIAQNADGGIDLLSTVGGVRGILETVLPGFVFIMVFALSSNLTWALVASIGLGVVFMIIRLAKRSTLIQSATGLIGILICAFAARHTGNAKDYYIPGFYTSGAYLLAMLVSVIVRWPLIGLCADGRAAVCRRPVVRLAHFQARSNRYRRRNGRSDELASASRRARSGAIEVQPAGW